ncbi:MAG TPA: chemotaxis protein CheB, partial [Pseudomonadota bacterium]|nr:chemotaxis protein CheB [Pseudomonadota bacterium]
LTIAQDADSSTVDGMPKAARESGAAEYWLPPADISSALLLLCQAEAPGTGGGSTNGGGGR